MSPKATSQLSSSTEPQRTSRIVVDVDPELHRRVKTAASWSQMTVKDFVTDAVMRRLGAAKP